MYIKSTSVKIFAFGSVSFCEHVQFLSCSAVLGVSYTSECTPCEAGFYNDQEGQGRYNSYWQFTPL